MTQPTLSVVVPVLNEERRVAPFFESWLTQTVVPSEIVVVDNGSTDGTVSRVWSFQERLHQRGIKLAILHEPIRGIVRCRDRGFRAARGEIIISADVDTEYASTYIERAASYFSLPGVAGVAARRRVLAAPWFIRVEEVIHAVRDRVVFWLINTVRDPRAFTISFRRQEYLSTKGMDVRLLTAEDESGLARLLNQRGRIVYDPTLVVFKSSRRHRQGGVLYYLFKTILWDYWISYWRAKYLGHTVVYDRVETD